VGNGAARRRCRSMFRPRCLPRSIFVRVMFPCNSTTRWLPARWCRAWTSCGPRPIPRW
jgi:hypothetical protein